MKNIVESIKKKYPVSKESIKLLTSYFEEEIFPPRTHIVRANVLDKKIFFIESGLTRSYILVNGNETTTWFSKEGDLAYGSLDFLKDKAGFEYVQTLEKTLTYSIPIEVLNNLYSTNIEIANWARVLHQDLFLLLQDLRIERLTLSAKERYDKLVNDYPNLCNRLNLGYIASYLGITLPTLSKIRAEK
ncbi:MAG: cyclic nucleotide-binding domain-containing protein [Tannerella sp.]|jgi:CRP-like cAMP-binding protein|nr:cyclic nucleotide-binding domain-containing protein [Tannerella sp.]